MKRIYYLVAVIFIFLGCNARQIRLSQDLTHKMRAENLGRYLQNLESKNIKPTFDTQKQKKKLEDSIDALVIPESKKKELYKFVFGVPKPPPPLPPRPGATSTTGPKKIPPPLPPRPGVQPVKPPVLPPAPPPVVLSPELKRDLELSKMRHQAGLVVEKTKNDIFELAKQNNWDNAKITEVFLGALLILKNNIDKVEKKIIEQYEQEIKKGSTVPKPPPLPPIVSKKNEDKDPLLAAIEKARNSLLEVKNEPKPAKRLSELTSQELHLKAIEEGKALKKTGIDIDEMIAKNKKKAEQEAESKGGIDEAFKKAFENKAAQIADGQEPEKIDGEEDDGAWEEGAAEDLEELNKKIEEQKKVKVEGLQKEVSGLLDDLDTLMVSEHIVAVKDVNDIAKKVVQDARTLLAKRNAIQQLDTIADLEDNKKNIAQKVKFIEEQIGTQKAQTPKALIAVMNALREKIESAFTDKVITELSDPKYNNAVPGDVALAKKTIKEWNAANVNALSVNELNQRIKSLREIDARWQGYILGHALEKKFKKLDEDDSDDDGDDF